MDETQALKNRIQELESKIAVLERDRIFDVLTGMKTRRFFEETAKDLLELQSNPDDQRRDVGISTLSIIFFDVDHFKKVNDTKGHLVGDEVLKEVAFKIHSSVRDSDTIARWGGEEFVVLLLGASEEDAYKKAEEIREKISELEIAGNNDLKLSISAGVMEAKVGLSLGQILDCADKALYRAKETGRNRVIKFSEL